MHLTGYEWYTFPAYWQAHGVRRTLLIKINALDEVFRDEQVVHRDMLQKTHHPLYGEIALVRNPMLSEPSSRTKPMQPIPALGEHTEEVLAMISRL